MLAQFIPRSQSIVLCNRLIPHMKPSPMACAALIKALADMVSAYIIALAYCFASMLRSALA